MDLEIREDGMEIPDFLRGYLGQKPVESDLETFESEDKNAIYVKLEDRVVAIEGIMSVYNLLNRSRGAHESFGLRNIANRYGDNREDILSKMDQKDKLAIKSLDIYFDTLVAAKSLEEAGFDDIVIQQEKELMRSDMWHEYGPGFARAYNRNLLINKVQLPSTKHLSKKY